MGLTDINPDFLNTLYVLLIAGGFAVSRLLSWLNHRSFPTVPDIEVLRIFSPEQFQKARAYHRAAYRFGWISGLFSTLVMLLFVYFKLPGLLDEYFREFSQHPVILAILFFLTLGFVSDIIRIPFDLYGTFVLEEKFGFNKTTVRTWVIDKIKGYLLALFLGGGIIALLTWIFESTGEYFWIIALVVATVISIGASLFYTSLILPLFNKLVPLEEGSLRDEIESYSHQNGFKLDRIFVMDGSRRSSRANAFFSGLGPRKTIVLFDTLLKDFTVAQLVAILAHEVGHYKLKHTLKTLFAGIFQSALTFFLLGLSLNVPVFQEALGAEVSSFHIGLIAFSILFAPVSSLSGIFINWLSRKHEFEADAFAGRTYHPDPLAEALIKLSNDNLSNPKPHPLFVFLKFSHPPVLERVHHLKLLNKAQQNTPAKR